MSTGYDPNQRRRYSLDGGTHKTAQPAAPKPSAAQAKPVNTSSFLTRIASTAIREAGGPFPAANQRPNWMSVDHSSPAANLNSRLRWVENAFKPENQPTQSQRPNPVNQGAQATPQQAPVQAQQPIAGAQDFKAAVLLMRKRMLTIHEEMAALDKELAEIESKMN